VSRVGVLFARSSRARCLHDGFEKKRPCVSECVWVCDGIVSGVYSWGGYIAQVICCVESAHSF
jgi:hypothetical protein